MQCVQLPVLKIPNQPNCRALEVPQKVRGLWIPRGFVWNGASVPAAVQALIGKPWDCEFQLASLLHDYLYVTHKATRRNADDWFYADLRRAGMGAMRAYTCWCAVRAFGARAWEINHNDPEHRFLSAAEVVQLEKRSLQ